VSCVKSIVHRGAVGGANTTRAAAEAGRRPRLWRRSRLTSTYNRYTRLRVTHHLLWTRGTRNRRWPNRRPSSASSQPLAAGRPPAAPDTDTSRDESRVARRRVALSPQLTSASLSPPVFVRFFFSCSRGGIGKLARRSGVAKVEIPRQLRDFQAQWGGDLPRSGVFHGLCTHKLCYRAPIPSQNQMVQFNAK
jgi:hypothetical protein